VQAGLSSSQGDVERQQSLFEQDPDCWTSGLRAGIDEVGIGPLAGPVVAAAVLLDAECPISELADSKAVTPIRREALAAAIREQALSWGLGWASVEEIDALNVLRASHLAMQRACRQLAITPEMVIVDGNKTPRFPVPSIAVIKGDQLVPQISAASILAKVARDKAMVQLDDYFPGYGFAKHKGYPTKQHLAALAQLGATPVHRRTFAPVRDALAQEAGA